MKLTIAICTYQRPEIADCLLSVAQQILPPELTLNVLIADNDETDIAKHNILQIAKQYDLNLTYVHAPARNISIARNACINHCQTDILVFIDDDETVTESWLTELVKTYQMGDADVVLGPVVSLYPEDAPQWIKTCDFHSSTPVFINGLIEVGYTCNTLINLKSPHFIGQHFDLALGRSGGEDTDYFSRAFKKGAQIKFAEKALVHEPVPHARTSFTWLMKRKFRFGQSYGLTLTSEQSGRFYKLKQLLKVGLKFSVCLAMSLLLCWHPIKKYQWSLRGCLHIGVISHLLGSKVIEQY